MAVRKCDWCHEEYHVYDQDAGSFLEHYCSEECEGRMDNAIDQYMEDNPPMMPQDLPAEF